MKLIETAKTMSVCFDTKEKAETLKNQLKDILEEHGAIRVADVYNALDMNSEYVNIIYGWTSTSKISVRKSVLGKEYFLRFPKPSIVD